MEALVLIRHFVNVVSCETPKVSVSCVFTDKTIYDNAS